MTQQKFQSCIDACFRSAVACEYCATACLGETDVAMFARCMELDRECAVVCIATGHLMSIGGDHAAELCDVCAQICDECAEECEKHAQHGMDHCRECAVACRQCAEECRTMAKAAV